MHQRNANRIQGIFIHIIHGVVGGVPIRAKTSAGIWVSFPAQVSVSLRLALCTDCKNTDLDEEGVCHT